MKITAGNILVLMQGMSENDLTLIRDKAIALLGPSNIIPIIEKDENEDLTKELLLYGRIQKELKDRGIFGPNFFTFRNTGQYKKFKQAHQRIDEYFDKNMRKTITKTERVKLYALVASLVISNIRNRELPLVPPLIMSTLLDSSALVDQAFPGYAEAGLLILLLDK